MLNLKVIGCGAAGNKAATELIRAGFNKADVTLLNSTSKDIPDEYKDISMIFGSSADSLGGCGKEREIGKNYFLNDLKSGVINIDGIVEPTTHAVIIVTSVEGGSGSGAAPILAKYMKDVCNIPVILIPFFGFGTDVRGLQNTIEFCQELESTYGVIFISNERFLEECNNNRRKAEEAANAEFVKIVRTLSGVDIKPGKQNIDDTDLYKLVVTPGYTCVGTANIKTIKNVEMFNKAINNAVDGAKVVDTTKTTKRIGCIFDIPDLIEDFVDFDTKVLAQRYGMPYEMYTHIQNTPTNNGGTVTWIAAGMDLPIQEIKEIFEQYKKNSANVSKKKDTFFGEVSGFAGNQDDSMFNMLSRPQRTAVGKDSFFGSYGRGKELVGSGSSKK